MTRKKKITLGLIGVLLAGLAILTYIRWEVWFGNPPEAPYTAPTVPSRVLLTFGNEGALSRNVSWQCDSVLQTSYLELGDENDTAIIDIPATGEVFASRSGKAAYYVARLTNLNHGQCYRYRVVTGGKRSPWYSFVARDAGMNEDFSFLYFGDVQDSLGGIASAGITGMSGAMTVTPSAYSCSRSMIAVPLWPLEAKPWRKSIFFIVKNRLFPINKEIA